MGGPLLLRPPPPLPPTRRHSQHSAGSHRRSPVARETRRIRGRFGAPPWRPAPPPTSSLAPASSPPLPTLYWLPPPLPRRTPRSGNSANPRKIRSTAWEARFSSKVDWRWGWVMLYSKRLNERLAGLGLAALLLVELGSRKALLAYHPAPMLLIQIYTVAATMALFIKLEKERISVWPEKPPSSASSPPPANDDYPSPHPPTPPTCSNHLMVSSLQ